MIKSKVFTLIEGLSRVARVSYQNGHLTHAQGRAFARAIARFQLRNKTGAGQIRIVPFVFNYPDARSFAYNFGEVFLDEEYFFKAETDSPVIVDCGANIGLATIYFKLVFPNARITSIEANPATFRFLETNINSNGLSGVEPMNVAVVGGDETEVSLAFGEAGDLRATRMKELHGKASGAKSEVVVRAVRLSTLLPESVDLLKMDIEGSEHDVIDDITPFFDRIKNVILEYHYAPSGDRRSLGEFITLMENAGFICRVKSANPADINFDPRSEYVATIYGSRPA